MSQRFHVGDLITIVSHRMVAPSGVDAIYRVVNYLTGQAHFTHQLSRAADACTPYLLEQHPWLAEITVPGNLSGLDEWRSWLDGIADTYGEYHEVQPMPFGAYLVELEEMVGKDRVIFIEVDPLDLPGGAT